MESPPRSRWYDVAWVLLWGAASSLWCLTAASRLSATFDEPFYIQQGLESWRTGSNDRLMRAGTMPLPVDVETLPLYVWERWRGAPFDVKADFSALIPVGRAANLVFWWLLLFYGWRLGHLLGGVWGARLSVALLACEPNLLAHACLATTDIAISACLLAFVYHFHVGRGRGWWRRIGVPSLWYGLSICAKASGLTFAPLCMVALELHRLWQEGHFCQPRAAGLWGRLAFLWTATRALRRDLYRIVALGLVVAFAYCGTDWKPQKSFVNWAATLPEGSLRDAMGWLAQNLRVFPNAGEGLVYQIKHNIRGHGVYIFGEWERRAVWYYFPAALLLKLSIPVLALLTVLLLRRPRTLASPAGAAALVLFLFSFNCRVQIGIRLILPLLCLLIVSLAIGLARVRPVSWPRWARVTAAAAAVLAAALPALTVWPHGLSYVNRLWGGPETGYRYVSDSNYDWGQGLCELARWQAEHSDRPLCVWYFGTDPRVERPPFLLLRLHQVPLELLTNFEGLMQGKYLAVGTTILHGNPALSASAQHVLQALRDRPPVGRTMTFFIYSFADVPPGVPAR